MFGGIVMIYYVSVTGNDLYDGSEEAPFKTIHRAASVAVAGDTVRVYGGTYREWVDPQNSGPIVYEAVAGEHPVIKGSEVITDWERQKGRVWKKTLPNTLFGDWNPFALEVKGDWLVRPTLDYRVHLGDVYLNGVSMFEARSKEELYDPAPRTEAFEGIGGKEYIPHPEKTVYQWYAEVGEETTTLYCNFGDCDPNSALVEINVRPCCFYPKATGVNDITVRGFEMAHAACPWAPPTADQIGMVGPHWSRGWVIENNRLHDAKCSAVSLGKEGSTGDNLSTRFRQKTGHRHQLEAVFAALQKGWSKETVGSHTVRNNVIYDCGQNGIVGHLGCIFSRIEHNHIYNIGTKHEFWGHEIAGIKLHSPIDTLIADNNVHDCTLGMWLDWQTQGTRVTRNLFFNNHHDFMLEVSHGPTLIDHNVFLSRYALDYLSQGSAFVHNLFGGKLWMTSVLNRTTPYHFPHSTAVAGYAEVYGGDDRYLNNIFIGRGDDGFDYLAEFTESCNKLSDPATYRERIDAEVEKTGFVDHGIVGKIPQPLWMEENAYSDVSDLPCLEKQAFVTDGITAEMTESEGAFVLTLSVPASLTQATCTPVSTARLGKTRLSEGVFEAPDGTDYDFSLDMTGERRNGAPSPGPFANLKAGQQKITLWKE